MALLQNSKGSHCDSLTGLTIWQLFPFLTSWTPSGFLNHVAHWKSSLHSSLDLLQSPFLVGPQSWWTSLPYPSVKDLERYSQMCNVLRSEPKEAHQAFCLPLQSRECKIQKFVFYCGEDVLAHPGVQNLENNPLR